MGEPITVKELRQALSGIIDLPECATEITLHLGNQYEYVKMEAKYFATHKKEAETNEQQS